MASPVGHSIAGVGSAVALAQVFGAPLTPELAIGAAVAGNIPDLDFLGPVIGIPSCRTHRHATHSLLFGFLLISSLVSIWSLLPGGLDLTMVLGWSAALISHLLVDLVTTSQAAASRGYGLPLLWPFNSRRWIIPQRFYHTADFGGMHPLGQKLRAAIPEIYVFGPLTLATFAFIHLLRIPGDWLPQVGRMLAYLSRILGH